MVLVRYILDTDYSGEPLVCLLVILLCHDALGLLNARLQPVYRPLSRVASIQLPAPPRSFESVSPPHIDTMLPFATNAGLSPRRKSPEEAASATASGFNGASRGDAPPQPKEQETPARAPTACVACVSSSQRTYVAAMWKHLNAQDISRTCPYLSMRTATSDCHTQQADASDM